MHRFTRNQVATAIAVLFHTVGLVGILVFKSDLIIHSTAFNLLLSYGLLTWTQQNRNLYFWLFTLAVMCIGFVVEVTGVNTGYLFGNYQYGKVLGIKWQQVPLVIAVNWFIVIYCCGMAVTALLERITKPVQGMPSAHAPVLKAISVISDGATLAVLFDWLIEPVAVKLGYWQWQGGQIPVYNYVCWFVISLALMTLFRFLPFDKRNKFAINLLLIQIMFFLLLRTFLN